MDRWINLEGRDKRVGNRERRRGWRGGGCERERGERECGGGRI